MIDRPDQAEVNATLAALYASPEFARAPVMRRLLDWLVAETMAGRGDTVKAYAVAVEGLGRDAGFDPQTDSYPRVQAGRLRKMLDSHFARTTDGTLALSLPSGGYRVVFRRRDEDGDPPAEETAADPPPSAPGGARRLILFGGAFIVLCAIVTAALLFVLRPQAILPAYAITRAPTLEIAVLTRPGAAGSAEGNESATAAQAMLADAEPRVAALLSRSEIIGFVSGGNTAADYVLRMASSADGSALALDLVHRPTSRQLWAERIPVSAPGEAFDMRLLRRTAPIVAPFGVIATDQRAILGDSFAPGYPCLLRFSSYFRDRAPDLVRPVAACIERTIEIEPNNVDALAAASYLQFDWSLTRTTPQMRERAADFARRAVRANPFSAHALVADARVAIVGRNCTRATALIERAVSLDPFDPDVLALSALLMAPCDARYADRLFTRARQFEPDLSPFYVAAEILLATRRGDSVQADALARSMRPPGPGMVVQYQLGRALADAANNRTADARARWQRIVAVSRSPRETPDEVLRQVYFSSDFRRMLVQSLRSAGVLASGPADRIGDVAEPIEGSPGEGNMATEGGR